MLTGLSAVKNGLEMFGEAFECKTVSEQMVMAKMFKSAGATEKSWFIHTLKGLGKQEFGWRPLLAFTLTVPANTSVTSLKVWPLFQYQLHLRWLLLRYRAYTCVTSSIIRKIYINCNG